MPTKSATKLALAAGLLVAATACSFAQAGFNPGTVVGNVYQNPLSGCGYGYGLGCNPPDHYGPHRVWVHRRRHGRPER
jgi:hypothetical protein